MVLLGAKQERKNIAAESRVRAIAAENLINILYDQPAGLCNKYFDSGGKAGCRSISQIGFVLSFFYFCNADLVVILILPLRRGRRPVLLFSLLVIPSTRYSSLYNKRRVIK
jgi:uncharacterized membrane protein